MSVRKKCLSFLLASFACNILKIPRWFEAKASGQVTSCLVDECRALTWITVAVVIWKQSHWLPDKPQPRM